MEIRLLRYFLAVAHEGNITRAAEALHISQPSLSKQMMELEGQLGKKLFVRGKRRIFLTDDGRLLRRRAEEIVEMVDRTVRELSAREEVSGSVSFGGNPTGRILEACSEMRREYPGVDFQFYSGDAIDVTERLDHGSIDFAVFLEPVDVMKYEYLSLNESSRWGLLVQRNGEIARKGVVSRDDIASVPLVFHRREGLQSLILRWSGKKIEDLDIATTYNVVNGEPGKFVRKGLGCFITTADLVSGMTGDDLVFCPFEPELRISYALVWKRYKEMSRTAEKFLESVRKNLKD